MRWATAAAKVRAMQNALDYLHDHKLDLLIGVLAVPLMTTLLFLEQASLAVRVLCAALLIGFVGLLLLSSYLGRRERGHLGGDIAFDVVRRGLVFTLGRQTDTPLLALQRQHPQWVGLLCTAESKPQADALIAALNLNPAYARISLVDGHNANHVHQQTLQLLAWLKAQGLGKHEMAVDVTGGLTTMSVGAFAAAQSQRVDTQYVRSDFDAQNKPIPNTQKGVFVVRYTPL